MKKIAINLVSLMIFMAVLSSPTYAQSNFEKDFSALHKKAVMTCGLIKKPDQHKKDEMLKGLQELRAQLMNVQEDYLKTPPKEYKNDPLWKSYFVEFNDAIDVLEARVEKENYKVAAMNCSRICMVYFKIHTVNGQLDLTDRMFLWISQITMTNNMLNAANYTDARNNLKQNRLLYKNVIDAKKLANNGDFDKQFETIEKLYTLWINDIESNNYQVASETFKEFKAAFGKVFVSSIM